MSVDIVVVGSCNTDLISYVTRLPKLGETISGESFQMGCGGKGANQCIAASRLGASVAMVAKIGEDIFGDKFIDTFKRNKVTTEHIHRSSDSCTGMASITVDTEGNNCIVIVEGANGELSVGEVEGVEGVIAKAKVLVCQLEVRQEVTLAALKLANKYNVFTILNPAPVPACGLDEQLIKYADIFCPNETEAQLITKLPFTTPDDAILGIPHLVKLGAAVTIVTLGDQGCVYCVGKGSEVKLMPAVKVKAVDTTGAGDAFVGSLAYCISRRGLKGCSGLDGGGSLDVDMVEKMLKVASEVASMCVQAKGSQVSYPSIQSLPTSLLSQIKSL